MYEFKVADMTCGHCVSSVTRAVKDLDASAQIEISLHARRVVVRSSASQAEIAEAIQEAGYTPTAT